MTCFGPDISSYQSGLNLSRLADASFVIAKTTEGTYYTDGDYQGTERRSLLFWAKVALPDPVTGCMAWMASRKPNGYGQFKLDSKTTVYAHRYAYELLVGSIPEGLQLDHLCRNRECVRPDHLEAVTQQENLRRGNPGIRQREKTRCPKGHDYAGENVRYYTRRNGGVSRSCRSCEKARVRKGVPA